MAVDVELTRRRFTLDEYSADELDVVSSIGAAQPPADRAPPRPHHPVAAEPTRYRAGLRAGAGHRPARLSRRLLPPRAARAGRRRAAHRGREHVTSLWPPREGAALRRGRRAGLL